MAATSKRRLAALVAQVSSGDDGLSRISWRHERSTRAGVLRLSHPTTAPGAGVASRRLSADALRAAVERIMEAGGCPANERELVASLLVEANLYGHDSHGIQMIYKYMKALQSGYVTPGARPVVRDAGGPMLVVDAKGVWGQVAYREAMELAIAKAQGDGGGVCVLALHNAHHIGRAGHYTEMAAAAGCVAIHFVNAAGHPALVAPYGGSDARMSTNPFSIAVPTGDGFPSEALCGRKPMSLDFATSIVANGKLQAAANKKVEVARGLIIDENGQSTTDPRYPTGFGGFQPGSDVPASKITGEFPGAILPFGLHKGAGLGFMCEILAGAVGGGWTMPPGGIPDTEPEPRGRPVSINSVLCIVIDPSKLQALAGQTNESQLQQVREEVSLSLSHTHTLPSFFGL